MKNDNKDINDKTNAKIVTALNLCAVSITKILESRSIEVMENEYNTVLNNLDLGKLEKHDALLEVLRKLLDVISFFRLQEGDRKRLEAKHQQQLNNLLWSSISQLRGLFVVSGNVCSIAAAAAIQGATMYFGYRHNKNQIAIQHEDDVWQLERSALEQLHGLRTALFETAWRLSEVYGFKDRWRLTTKQIEWYNHMCNESDNVVRYKTLEQYGCDYGFYPYYWYELGVAAQSIAAELGGKGFNDEKDRWLKCAEDAFDKFLSLDTDVSFLRQNSIGADARIRRTLLMSERIGWVEAIRKMRVDLAEIRDFAVENGDLIFKAAMIYASAYEELVDKAKNNDNDDGALRDESFENATRLLELLAYSGNNLPIASMLLSRLYIIAGRKEKYEDLRLFASHLPHAGIVLIPFTDNLDDAQREDMQHELEEDLAKVRIGQSESLVSLVERQFDIIIRLAHESIFNAVGPVRRRNLLNWVRGAISEGEENYKTLLFAFWESLKEQLNMAFLFNVRTLQMPEDDVRGLADRLNSQTYRKISNMSSRKSLWDTARKREEKERAAMIEMQNWVHGLRKLYIRDIMSIASAMIEKGVASEDIGLQMSMQNESMVERYQLIGMSESSDSSRDEIDFFDVDSAQRIKDGRCLRWDEYTSAQADTLYANKMSFSINLCRTETDGSAIDERHYRAIMKILKNRYPESNTSWRDETKQTARAVVEECGSDIRKGVEEITTAFKGKSLGDGLKSLVGRTVQEFKEKPKKAFTSVASGAATVVNPASWFIYKTAPTACATTLNSLKSIKGELFGKMDFVITEWPNRIDIVYTKRKDDEGSRDVDLLSPLAVEREFKRLLDSYDSLDDDDKTRLGDIICRWLEIRKEAFDVGDKKDQEDVVKEVMTTFSTYTKDLLQAELLKDIFAMYVTPRIAQYGKLGCAIQDLFS